MRGAEASAAPEAPVQQTVIQNYYQGLHYEYRSKRTLWGLPLVHIHLQDRGLCRAKGIIAIGNVATGLVAIGGFSAGLVSVGAFSAGLLALGALAVGAAAAGGLAVGLLAALGGCAFSLGLSFGGCAISRFLAVGGAAIGQDAGSGSGLAITLEQLNTLHLSPAELLSWLQAQAPEAPRWALRLLLAAAGR